MLETNATSLEALLAQVALGNREAFDALYRGTANRLFGICLRVLTERSEAEDALQDVFTTVWRKASQFDATRATATAWLAMIARNKAIDRLRSMPARQTRASLDLVDELEDPGASPPQQAQAATERAQLETCLERLEPRRRSLIRARASPARSSAPPFSTGSPMRSWRRGSRHPWARSKVGSVGVCCNYGSASAREHSQLATERKSGRKAPSRRLTRFWPENSCWACWTPPSIVRRRRVWRLDRAFAQRVAEWERSLAPWLADIEPVEPPAQVWARICLRLGGRTVSLRRGGLLAEPRLLACRDGPMPARGGRRDRLVIAGRPDPSPEQPPVAREQPPATAEPGAKPVTPLAHDDGTPGWLASVDAAHGTVLMVPVPHSA